MTLSPVSSRGSASGAVSGVTVTGVALAGQVPVASSSAAGAWGYPPGYQFDYVENVNASIAITSTTAVGANVIIDGNPVTYDGVTKVQVQFGAYDVNTAAAAKGTIIDVWDGATDLGRMGVGDSSAGQIAVVFYASRILTPSAGAHTFHIKGWCDQATTIDSGAGGPGAVLPCWYRIVKV